LVGWVEFEKLAKSSHLALEDFWVVGGQLEKVTEVASARPVVRRISHLPANPSDLLAALRDPIPGARSWRRIPRIRGFDLLGHSVKGD
jgi:hypothetical protein